MSNIEDAPGNNTLDGHEQVGSGEGFSILQEAAVLDLGSVKEATLGSSASGSADANSQYYW